MQGVDGAAFGDRLLRRGQRLPEDLAPEDAAPAEVLALTAEDVLFDALEAENCDQLTQHIPHGARA